KRISMECKEVWSLGTACARACPHSAPSVRPLLDATCWQLGCSCTWTMLRASVAQAQDTVIGGTHPRLLSLAIGSLLSPRKFSRPIASSLTWPLFQQCNDQSARQRQCSRKRNQ